MSIDDRSWAYGRLFCASERLHHLGVGPRREDCFLRPVRSYVQVGRTFQGAAAWGKITVKTVLSPT
jgi:hypothetical protein